MLSGMLSRLSSPTSSSRGYDKELIVSDITPELPTIDQFLARFREHSSNMIANAYK